MKEATGELNTAVITVILVASLASFFYFTIWPTLRSNLNKNVGCSKAICDNKPNDDGTVNCEIWENGVLIDDNITCVWKG